MAFKYKPVRERAIEALVAHLEEIQEANGYNYSVRSVTRKRTLPTRSYDPPELYVFVTGAEHYVQNTAQYKDKVNIEVWFILNNNSGDEEDTIYNMMVADIQRALTCYSVIDTSHPDPKGRIVDVETTGDRPLYSNVDESQIIGKVEMYLEHTRMLEDPNLWDLEDTAVPKEE